MGFDDTRRPGWDHWISFHAQGLYINPVVNVDGERRQLRGYMTDFLNESAVRFLERPHSKPFVLYVAHKAVHIPYLPAARHDKLYSDAQFNPPPVAPGDLEGKPVMRAKHPQVDPLRMEGRHRNRRIASRPSHDSGRDRARSGAVHGGMDEGMAMIFDAVRKIRRTGKHSVDLFERQRLSDGRAWTDR